MVNVCRAFASACMASVVLLAVSVCQPNRLWILLARTWIVMVMVSVREALASAICLSLETTAQHLFVQAIVAMATARVMAVFVRVAGWVLVAG